MLIEEIVSGINVATVKIVSIASHGIVVGAHYRRVTITANRR